MLTENRITLVQVANEKKRFRDAYSITNENNTDFLSDITIKEAINLARGDLMVRTLKKIQGKPGINEITFDELANMIYAYFTDSPYNEKSYEKTEKGFDEWHYDACSSVLCELKKSYSNVEYGKAQKLVNMTFKYMYCYDGAKKYEKYFKYCHMPLDSFTLEWFKREANRESNTVTAEKIPSWSNLQYSTNESLELNNKYTYNFFVKEIRELFPAEGSNITPFQAEFVIWPQIQLKLAAEAFLFQLQRQNSKLTNTTRKNGKENPLELNLETIKEEIDCWSSRENKNPKGELSL